MKALVSTINHILFVDLQTLSVQVLEQHRGDYYGISWWKDSEYPVMAHSVLRGEDLLTLEDYATSEKGYISFGKKRSPSFLSNPHQILCAPNGWIIATNTGRNRITIYDPMTGFYKDLMVNEILWDRMGKDNLCGEHFNSVFIKDDRLYVLAHGFKKYAYVLEYSYPDCELITKHDVRYRTGLHNIWVDDAGNMFSCHSASGELIEIKSDEVVWRGSAFHSRGLAVTSDLIIVGDSEIAMRDDRKHSHCGLWVIDRKTLKTIDYFSLGRYGSCHEVRILDVPDEAHHGVPFTNIDALTNDNSLEKDNDKAIKSSFLSQKRREDKLTYHNSFLNNDFARQVNFIVGCIDFNEQGWLAPRDEYIHQSSVIAVARQQPERDFHLSIDYAFPFSRFFKEQHLSLIAGYKGSNDNNMIAVFLHYTVDKECYLYLIKNKNGVWEAADKLLNRIPAQGKLEVIRYEDKLKIICNGSKPIERKFDQPELEGAVGIRCQGSQFRNFSVHLNNG